MNTIIETLREKGFVTKEPVSPIEPEYNTLIRPTVDEIASQYDEICEVLYKEYQDLYSKFVEYTLGSNICINTANELGASAKLAKELYTEFADTHVFKPRTNYRECDYMTDEKRFYIRQNKDVC